MRSQRLRVAFARLGLPLWFLMIDTQVIGPGTLPGGDAILYAHGAASYIHGLDPWSASLVANGQTYHFAGLPPTVLAFIPFSGLPDWVTGWGWVVLSALSAGLIVWRLKLTWFYLLFPPLLSGVASGNPQIALLALLLVGAGPLASLLKIYAIVPMVGERRWRSVTVSGALLLATVAVAPGLWATYASRLSQISSTLITESHGGFSAWGQPWPILAATVVALLVIARFNGGTAGWLAVPAIWPASEYHYATMILPISAPLLAFAIAIPWYGVPALVTIGYAAVLVMKTFGKDRWPLRRTALAGAV